MKQPDWLWKGLLYWFCLFNQFSSEVEGRRYDKCSTQDGRQGVCVVKRYCREATTQSLLPCDDDDSFCCPIPTTHRSAAPTFSDSQPPARAPANERPKPISPVDDRISPSRTYIDDGPSRPYTSYDRGANEPRREIHEDRGRRPEINQDRRHFDDRIRPDRDKPDDPERQPSNDRPKKLPDTDPPVRDSPRVFYDDDRRSLTSQGHPTEISSTNRNRDGHSGRDDAVKKLDGDRRNDRRDSEDPRRPTTESSRHYPARDELDSHSGRDRDSPRRPKPTRNSQKNRTTDASRTPIKFPDTYELSVPRPRVPACGVKPYELFIAGGEESKENEWPWMTAIFRRYQDSRPKTFLCGGSLINTKYVLTAAHCFVNNYVVLPASSFVVRLGSHFLNSGEEYTVANLVIHHNHSGSDFFNDIALVRLASEVYVTDKIAPICLPFPEMASESFVGRLATVAGWGDTAFRTSGTRILQHVTVPVVSSEECFAAYSRVRGAAFLARGSDHVICAGLREGGKDACLGDSGGPLMLKTTEDQWVVIGIVSLGYKCAEPGYPGVYTRVSHYTSWIKTNMKRY